MIIACKCVFLADSQSSQCHAVHLISLTNSLSSNDFLPTYQVPIFRQASAQILQVVGLIKLTLKSSPSVWPRVSAIPVCVCVVLERTLKIWSWIWESSWGLPRGQPVLCTSILRFQDLLQFLVPLNHIQISFALSFVTLFISVIA